MARSYSSPTKLFRSALVAAAILAAPIAAQAQPVQPTDAVARTFMTAARSQDRQAALQLLDEKVSIQFPGQSIQGHGEGQPFVIGYLDGLFYGQRGVSLDGGATAKGGVMRFLGHDADFRETYAIDVEVKNQHVVRVTVNLQKTAVAQASPTPHAS